MRLVVLLLLLTSAGCMIGREVREEALLPVLRAAAVGVEADARAGLVYMPIGARVSAQIDVDNFFMALKTDPLPSDLLSTWPSVAVVCETGFSGRAEAGEIGVNVAGSLRERVARFGAGLSQYLGGTKQ